MTQTGERNTASKNSCFVSSRSCSKPLVVFRTSATRRISRNCVGPWPAGSFTANCVPLVCFDFLFRQQLHRELTFPECFLESSADGFVNFLSEIETSMQCRMLSRLFSPATWKLRNHRSNFVVAGWQRSNTNESGGP
uniref:(northern house mosquito) hypothetical protein n=1 Tax=Culex pipiens TaxID=7175 RepID=A0A8D7ZZB9_CULPI